MVFSLSGISYASWTMSHGCCLQLVGCETSTEQAPNLVKAALGFLSFTQIEKIVLKYDIGSRSKVAKKLRTEKFGKSGLEYFPRLPFLFWQL